MEIWTHYPHYSKAVEKVTNQTLEKDLATLDDLFGRDQLSYGATPEDVKREALKQLEIEFRDKRDEVAEFMVAANPYEHSVCLRGLEVNTQ